LTDGASHTRAAEPNVGVAVVPDARLAQLADIFHSKKISPATIDCIDTPGLVKGAAVKETSPIAALRAVDVLVQVVRAFRDNSIPHTEGNLDPARDIKMLEFELLLADMAMIDRQLEKLTHDMKKLKSRDSEIEFETLRKLKSSLESERPLRERPLTYDEERRIGGLTFLSAKPMLYVLNLGDQDIDRFEHVLEDYSLQFFAARKNTAFTVIYAKLDRELKELPEQEAALLLQELGLKAPAPDRLIKDAYMLLNLITFFTGNENEVHAWTVKRHTTALKAAGAVHADIERGFLRAEVVHATDLIAFGSLQAVRDKGLLRLEGKDYLVGDGDVMNFRFQI
jgi:GTP-binding protein YchF